MGLRSGGVWDVYVGLRSGGGWDVCETCHIAIAAMCDHAMCDSESVSRNVLVLLRVGEKVLFLAIFGARANLRTVT